MPREMDWSPTVASASEGVPVNLLHMELLHHFERFTMPTLCWQEVWPTMLQMAFRVRSFPQMAPLSARPMYPSVSLVGEQAWDHRADA